MSSLKTLYIVRHAKSSWDYEGISDLDRPLKLKGIRDAYEMARRVKIECQFPDLLISSPAIRALHTAEIFTRVLELNHNKLCIDEKIYGSGLGVIKKLLSDQDESIKRLMIFGHNPDFSELATILSGKPYIELPTCGVVRFDFEVSQWALISSKNMKNMILDSPKKELS